MIFEYFQPYWVGNISEYRNISKQNILLACTYIVHMFIIGCHMTILYEYYVCCLHVPDCIYRYR